MSNDTLIDQYLVWVKGGHPDTTVVSYMYALRPLRKWLEANKKELLKLRPADAGEYLMHLQNLGLKSGTRSHYSTTLRGLWKWLRDQGSVVWSEEMIPIPEKVDVISHACLSWQDFEKILATFNELIPLDIRNKTIFRLLMLTGMRPCELQAASVQKVDLVNKRINIKTYKRKNHYRDVYWDDETNRLLTKWLELRECLLKEWGIGSDALFVGFNSRCPGNTIDKSAIQKFYRAHRERAGVKTKITPYSSRHGHATFLAANGMDAYKLKEDMGHANIKNTMVYVHTRREDVQEAHQQAMSRHLQKGVVVGTMVAYGKSSENKTQPQNLQEARNGLFIERSFQSIWTPPQYRS